MSFQKLALILSCSFWLIHGLAFAQSATDFVNSSKNAGENLTDEEQMITETFIHEGKTQEQMNEACNKDPDMMAACQGRDVNPETMGISGGMVKALTKAYTMIIGAGALSGNGGLTMVDADDATKAGDTAKETPKKTPSEKADAKKKEEQDDTDYCQFIAIGTEAVAVFQQTTAQQDLQFQAQTGPQADGTIAVAMESQQKKALYKAAKSHGERAKNAKFQAAGWGVTTACYAAMMMRPSVSKSSWGNWLKLAAAGLLSAFFLDQAGEHEKYEKKVKRLADDLPGVGDCNPVTDRECYCAQESTANDPKYCLPELHKRAIAANSFRVACTDNKAKADPQCKCQITNTCLDTEITRRLQATATDLNAAMSSSFLKPFQALARGELQSASLNGSALGLANNAKRQVSEVNKKLSQAGQGASVLTAEQQREANALKGLGASDALASKLALTSLGPNGKKNLSKFSGGRLSRSTRSNQARRNKGSNVLTFKSASSQQKRRSRKKLDNPFAKFGKKRKKSRGKQASVLKFAQRAENQASQIDRRKDTAIFDIISHRYRKTGMDRLGIK